MLVVLRYLYWRTTSTLPPAADWTNFVPGVLLYGAEVFCILMMFLSLFVVIDPLDRRSPRLPADDRLPGVDVLVPSYNESADLLATTLAAAKAMDYPADRLTVYLLDDGGTDEKCASADPIAAAAARQRRAELERICAELGVVYHARAVNRHAKAGNLNAGLARSTGTLVAVFDADHAPAREFLRLTVGHFLEDPRLFLVQTPHFFLNPDPIEKNLATFSRMPSENEMFYDVVQRGLDKWNAAFFCGSAALLSRAALDEAGGFSGLTITEDCETALELHARGWTSRYVDTPLIAGLQPETLDSFIGQRSRWCRGMIQILLMKNPLLKRGLGLAQRLCYLSTAMFWLFPLPRLAFMVAPLCYLFFGVKIFVGNGEEFLAYTASYLAVSLMLQSYLYGRVRWPWISELYEYIQSVYLAGAIGSVIVNPKKPTFNVTAKGVTLEEDHISVVARPYALMFALLLAGLAATVWRYDAEPATSDLTLFVGAWNLFNLVIAGTALGVVIEKRERRRNPRLAIARDGVIRVEDREIPVRIEDASIGGVRLRPLAADLPRLTFGMTMRLGVAGAPHIPETLMRVRRIDTDRQGTILGLEYAAADTAHFRVVAELMFGEASPFARFRALRRTGKGVLAGSLHFLGLAVREAWRVTRFLAIARLGFGETADRPVEAQGFTRAQSPHPPDAGAVFSPGEAPAAPRS